jgi:hypothetical protein
MTHVCMYMHTCMHMQFESMILSQTVYISAYDACMYVYTYIDTYVYIISEYILSQTVSERDRYTVHMTVTMITLFVVTVTNNNVIRHDCNE